MKERKRDSSFIRFSLTSVGTHFPRSRPLKRNITSLCYSPMGRWHPVGCMYGPYRTSLHGPLNNSYNTLVKDLEELIR